MKYVGREVVMKQYIHKFISFILKLIVSFVVISGILVVIALVAGFGLSDTFMVAGVICFAAGLLTKQGRRSMQSDTEDMDSESNSDQYSSKNPLTDFRSRLNKIGFLSLSISNGFLMLILSYILAIINI
jgi:flagellar biosynthesis component FlhA